MNSITVVWDLLTLNVLLRDIGFVEGNFIGEFSRRNVRRFDNTMGILKQNDNIDYGATLVQSSDLLRELIWSFRLRNKSIWRKVSPDAAIE